jgi:DNA polymerase (family X)
MSNQQISRLLRHVAAAYTIKNEQKYRFQIIAYQRAADAIEASPTEATELYQEGRLEALPGVGTSIRTHIEELFKTGQVSHFSWVLKDIPASVFPLLEVPSFGPKKAYKLVIHFNLTNPETVITDLENLATQGKVATLEGFGKKSEEDILTALQEFKRGIKKNVRMVLPFATELAEKIITYLTASNDVLAAYPLGSLRRRRETIGDIDIAVSTNDPEAVLTHFTAFPYKERVIERGERTAGLIAAGGKHIDLMVQPPESFGSLLQHFTGSKEHNIKLRELALKKGMSLSEYGIKIEEKMHTYDTEEKFYKALGLAWIPPEIRENNGEIELAAHNTLPRLVELSDIKGDFHLHSSYPIEPSHDMGKHSMEDMVRKAQELNYRYIGFSEHNPSVSKHTPEQTYALLHKRSKFIEHLSLKNKNSVRIFSLIETDTLANGKLALEDDALSLLDGVLVSIHSSFDMDKKSMTKRVLAGLSHPKAKILSHPTGRLLNQRAGYELDWDEIFHFCKQNNKALEINSWPLRLDLPDSLVLRAVRNGNKFFINTDSHALNHMDMMRYGVSVARRGWATKDDILNTFDYNDLASWFRT